MLNLSKFAGIILLLIIGLIAGCNPFAAAKEPDKVTVQLSWFHSVEFAGFYAAEQQKYYADENLAVTLLPGSAEIVSWQDVAEGKADFGITGGDALMIARSKGLDIKAVATIFRQSPIVMMALAESGIKTPQDFVGKRVGIFSETFDNANDIQLLAMLRKLGIDESELEMVLIEDYSLGSLTSGAMDVYSGFLTEEPARAEADDLNLIFPQDYGVLMYANVIATRQQLIDENPDLVERFVRATLKGYQYAIEHVDEMPKLASKYDNNLNLEFQLASMQTEVAMIDTGDTPIGMMDEEVWQSTQDILLEQKFISAPIDLKTVYTNEFVEKAQ
ncbi:MAG: ABC transporter substrate-binding protein [Anaerolineae bacterium]|nr:ABC transporter substrate-binding protein [Anaerolineae bacterium]